MFQKWKALQLSLLGAIGLGLLAGAALLVWRLSMKQDSSRPAARHKVKNSPQEALKYWTADRMRKAKPAPMPHIDGPEKKIDPKHPAPSSDPR